jgi:hypothetical protein
MKMTRIMTLCVPRRGALLKTGGESTPCEPGSHFAPSSGALGSSLLALPNDDAARATASNPPPHILAPPPPLHPKRPGFSGLPHPPPQPPTTHTSPQKLLSLFSPDGRVKPLSLPLVLPTPPTNQPSPRPCKHRKKRTPATRSVRTRNRRSRPLASSDALDPAGRGTAAPAREWTFLDLFFWGARPRRAHSRPAPDPLPPPAPLRTTAGRKGAYIPCPPARARAPCPSRSRFAFFVLA